MSSVPSSEKSPPETDRQKVANYLEGKGKLELWSGVQGMQSILNHNNRQDKNIAGEDAAVRRTMGWDIGEPEENDMQQTVLGDLTTNNHVVNERKKSLLGPIAAMALGAAIPGAGLAGMLISNYLDKAPDVTNVIEGEDVQLGLGKIDDYE